MLNGHFVSYSWNRFGSQVLACLLLFFFSVTSICYVVTCLSSNPSKVLVEIVIENWSKQRKLYMFSIVMNFTVLGNRRCLPCQFIALFIRWQNQAFVRLRWLILPSLFHSCTNQSSQRRVNVFPFRYLYTYRSTISQKKKNTYTSTSFFFFLWYAWVHS